MRHFYSNLTDVVELEDQRRVTMYMESTESRTPTRAFELNSLYLLHSVLWVSYHVSLFQCIVTGVCARIALGTDTTPRSSPLLTTRSPPFYATSELCRSKSHRIRTSRLVSQREHLHLCVRDFIFVAHVFRCFCDFNSGRVMSCCDAVRIDVCALPC